MWVLRGAYIICAFNVWWISCSEEPSTSTEIRQAVNSFSVELLKELSGEQPKNLIVSPVSVSTLLAILHQGARHNSSSQLESVLHLNQQQSKEGYGLLSRKLKESRNTTSVLEVANQVFVRQNFQLTQEFRDVAVQDFQSGVQIVSFGTGEGGSAINNWASQATHGRIPSIVDPVLSGDTVLVIANAIYFKSPWENRFSKYSTSNQTFSSKPGKNVTVPFMHHYGELFRAGIDAERALKWVQLPFTDGGYSMVIIVPDEKFGLADVLRNFTGETLGSLLQAGTYRDVTLHLPRFRLSSTIKLEAPLQELGAKDIFDSSLSDLSGVTTSAGNLYVSKALQKADIEVDEEGATAAAVTVIQLQRNDARAHFPAESMTIAADHPFLAVLVDGTNRMPLFMATVIKPSI